MRVSHKKVFIIAGGILLLIYGLWQSRDYLRGPQLYLESPADGAVLTESLISVKGQATDISKFSLNGRTIFTDEDGRFEEKILLAPGINNIELWAEDKFGHQKRIERTVLLK
jgi:hypothetical protein